MSQYFLEFHDFLLQKEFFWILKLLKLKIWLVIPEFCMRRLSVCSVSTAFTSLCRSLKYLLKVWYITLNYPNMAQIWIFEPLSLSRAKTLTYVRKKNKNEWHLSLLIYSFTQLSHNVCLINTHIFIYWYVRCNCK